MSVFISHLTTSETEIKLIQALTEFWNYFKIVSATLNMLENIHELQSASEINYFRQTSTDAKKFYFTCNDGTN